MNRKLLVVTGHHVVFGKASVNVYDCSWAVARASLLLGFRSRNTHSWAIARVFVSAGLVLAKEQDTDTA